MVLVQFETKEQALERERKKFRTHVDQEVQRFTRGQDDLNARRGQEAEAAADERIQRINFERQKFREAIAPTMDAEVERINTERDRVDGERSRFRDLIQPKIEEEQERVFRIGEERQKFRELVQPSLSALGSVGGGLDDSGGVPQTLPIRTDPTIDRTLADRNLADRPLKRRGLRSFFTEPEINELGSEFMDRFSVEEIEQASTGAELIQRFQGAPAPEPDKEGFSFKRLAEGLTAPNEPLSASVGTLGRGIVGTPSVNDFGQRGGVSAVTPETRQFVEQGTDVISGSLQTAFSSAIPPAFWDEVEKIPVAGDTLRRQGEFWTSPGGVAILLGSIALQGAGQTALELAGETGAGALGRLLETEAGAPSGTRPVFEAIGGVGAGVAGARGARGAARGLIPDEDIPAARRALDDLVGTDVTPTGAVDEVTPRLAGEGLSEADNTKSLAGGASSRDELAGLFEEAAPRSEAAWARQMDLRSEELGSRTSRMATRREELIAEGVSPNEAAEMASGELRGKMPVVSGAFGVDMSRAQEALFWDLARKNLRDLELLRMSTAMREVAELERNFLPNEWDLIEKVMGRSFRETAEKSAELRPPGRLKRPNLEDLPTPPGSPGEPLGIPGSEALKRNAQGDLIPRAGSELEGPIPASRGTADDLRLTLAGDVRKPARGTEVPTSLGAEEPTLASINAPGTVTSVSSRKGIKGRLIDIIANSVGILRPIMASIDLSWTRQSVKTVARHPFLTGTSMKQAAKAALSESSAVNWMRALETEGIEAGSGFVIKVRTSANRIEDLPLGLWAKENLHMAVPGTPGFGQTGILSRPEFFVSQFAQTIPGVRQSGRAFAIGGNTQMQGMARYWIKHLTSLNGGAISSRQLDTLADMIQRLNGRGDLGGNWFSQALRALGFAPGYRISGPQSFLHLMKNPLIKENRQLQLIAAQELASWATLGSTIMSAAKYGVGATVVMELGSTQFGRVKFPGTDTFYNIWGTDLVLARTIIQALKGERLDTLGNITPLGNQEGGASGFATGLADAGWQYLKSGEDPVVGLMTEIASGETFLGKPLKYDLDSLLTMTQDRAPLLLQDMKDVASTDGIISAMFAAPAGAVGVGISSYRPVSDQFRVLPQFNSADLGITRNVFPNMQQPLNLTANEERAANRFLNKEVQDWIAAQPGPRPEEAKVEDIILFVAKQEELSGRGTAAVIFMHKAKSHRADWGNPKWVQFGMENRAALEDRFDNIFDTQYWKTYEQTARGLGLIE